MWLQAVLAQSVCPPLLYQNFAHHLVHQLLHLLRTVAAVLQKLCVAPSYELSTGPILPTESYVGSREGGSFDIECEPAPASVPCKGLLSIHAVCVTLWLMWLAASLGACGRSVSPRFAVT